MSKSNTFARLQRFWQRWEATLQSLAQKKGAKIIFPKNLREVDVNADSETFEPLHPVLIFNAPPKGSSRFIRGSSHKIHIFIGGNIKILKNDSKLCVTHSCNITIFKDVSLESDRLTVKLVESMHFDVDISNDPAYDYNHFHPIYHVQRGPGYDEKEVKKLLSQETHISPENIEIKVDGEVFGTPYLRVPTPQLDVFSVMTMVAADFLCNGGDAIRDAKLSGAVAGGKTARTHDISNVRTLFVGLLDLLRDPENLARQGRSTNVLKERWENGQHVSTAHWYPECA